MHKKWFDSEKIAYLLLVLTSIIVLAMFYGFLGPKNGLEKSWTAQAKIGKGQTTVVKSIDGLATLVVPKNTQSSSPAISIERINNPGIDSESRVSNIYRFGPSLTYFSSPVELRIKYSPELAGSCPSSLDFFHFNEDGSLKEVIASKSVYCSSDIAVFEISSFSEGYAGNPEQKRESSQQRGNCEDEDRAPDGVCSDIPEIDSISPTSLKTGEVLTINGKFLTRTVQFFDSKGNRSSYNWAHGAKMNADRSQMTIPIPADLPSDNYRVRIWTSRTVVSNEKELSITSTGAGSGNGPGCQTKNNPNIGNYPTLTYPSCIDELDDPRQIKKAFENDDVGIFTVCRDVVWMIRNTNKALSCSSDFTYQGIPAATWKGWVENEAKALDDACIGVCHPGLECERQPDSVDKDKLLRALENYLKNCIKRKGISCVCNPNPDDPVCGPFVQHIGGISTGAGSNCNPGIGTTTATISFSWSPKLTDNGWFPRLSPDGIYVTYGFGENWVADLQTGEERSLTIKKGESFNGYWIRPDTYTFLNIYSNAEADRYEVKVGEWIAKKTNDNPQLAAGNQFVAADGHWASYLASNGRIAYDNNEVATDVGGTLSVSDDWIVHASDKDNTAIQVWRNGQKSATYIPKTPLHGMSVNKGYIVYGGYGPVHGISPDGQDMDLTATPWRKEGIGGVVFANNQPWVYTLTWNDAQNKGYILIRPWGEKASIVIEAAAVSVHIVYVNNEFVIAYNSDKGQLSVVKVPVNSQMVDLSNPSQPVPGQPSSPPTGADTILPSVTLSFNRTDISQGIVLNVTCSATDNTGLRSANISHNMTGTLSKTNFAIAGLSAQVSNIVPISIGYGVINFTCYSADSSNNLNQISSIKNVLLPKYYLLWSVGNPNPVTYYGGIYDYANPSTLPTMNPIPSLSSPGYNSWGWVWKQDGNTYKFFFRHGKDHLTDGVIVESTYHADTNTWTPQRIIYNDLSNGYESRNIAGGVIGNKIYLMFDKCRNPCAGWTDGRWGYITSTDNGATWSNFVDFSSQVSHFPSKIVEANGNYLIAGVNLNGLVISKSSDNGNTWIDEWKLIATDPNLQEPTLVSIGNGKLIVLLRNDAGGYLTQSTSSDYGNTWGAPATTNLQYASGVHMPFMEYDDTTNTIILVYAINGGGQENYHLSISDANTVFNSATSWNAPLNLNSYNAYVNNPTLFKIDLSNPN
ncbi:exo-alpha-sialidase [Candidatus Woesearchaeota archaeon]|nr:exo-alpha-sialidase [Candidatus Woesearchaeota archaeon]